MARVITFKLVRREDYELLELIDKITDSKKGLSRSDIIREALREYIRKHYANLEGKYRYNVEHWVIR